MLGLRLAQTFRCSIKQSQFKIGSLSPLKRLNSSISNFNDPDAKKPTLAIDAYAKSKRLNRPVSPNLFIYQPQLTWVMSGFHRATGGAIAVLFYLSAMSYAVLPMESALLVQYVHSYPGALIFLGKVAIGFPLFFHSFNGVRHLVLSN